MACASCGRSRLASIPPPCPNAASRRGAKRSCGDGGGCRRGVGRGPARRWRSSRTQRRHRASSPFGQLHLRRFERDGDCSVMSSLMLFLGFHFGSSSPGSCRNLFQPLSATRKEGRLPRSCSRLRHVEEGVPSKAKPVWHDTTGEVTASFHSRASLCIAASLKTSARAFDLGLGVTLCFAGEIWQR